MSMCASFQGPEHSKWETGHVKQRVLSLTPDNYRGTPRGMAPFHMIKPTPTGTWQHFDFFDSRG